MIGNNFLDITGKIDMLWEIIYKIVVNSIF